MEICFGETTLELWPGGTKQAKLPGVLDASKWGKVLHGVSSEPGPGWKHSTSLESEALLEQQPRPHGQCQQETTR